MPNPHRWPLRVGLVGYGFAGRIFHAPLIHATPGLELAAICSSRRSDVLAEWPHLPVVSTPEALFAQPDLDLVVIATPNRTHAPLATAALRTGLHVVVDKPFTLTVAQAREVAAVAQAHGRVLSVFQNRRWDSDFLGIRHHIRSGVIGRVTELESRMDRFRPQVRARWRETDAPGSGLWFDLGPHMADQVLQLFGLPDSIQASMTQQRDHASGTDWAQVIFSYGALRVSLHCSLLAAWSGPRFIVHGTQGSLLKHHGDQQENQLRTGHLPGASGWGHDPDDIMLFDGTDRPRPLSAPPGDYRIYYALVRDAIMKRGPNPVPPIQAIALMAVLETAVASSEAGKALSLPLTGMECQQWAQGIDK